MNPTENIALIQEVNDWTDNLDLDEQKLKKAIRTTPISVFDKKDLDNDFRNIISNFKNNLDSKLAAKGIKDGKGLDKETEKKLDIEIVNFKDEINKLITSFGESFELKSVEEKLSNIDTKGNEKLTNILDGIKYYEAVRIKPKIVKIVDNTNVNDKGIFYSAIDSFANTAFGKFKSKY